MTELSGQQAATFVSRPMPRLGRGVVWSAIAAEIEAEQRAHELPPLPKLAEVVTVPRSLVGPMEPSVEDVIAAALTGDVVPPPPLPSTPLEDVRAYVQQVAATAADIPSAPQRVEAIKGTGWLRHAIGHTLGADRRRCRICSGEDW